MHSGPSRQSRSAQPPTALRRGEYGRPDTGPISFCAAPGRYRRRAGPPPAPPGQGRPRPKRKNCCFPSVQWFRLLQIPWFFLLSCWPGDMHPALVWLLSAGAAQCLGSRSSLCPVASNQLGSVAQRGSAVWGWRLAATGALRFAAHTAWESFGRPDTGPSRCHMDYVGSFSSFFSAWAFFIAARRAFSCSLAEGSLGFAGALVPVWVPVLAPVLVPGAAGALLMDTSI